VRFKTPEEMTMNYRHHLSGTALALVMVTSANAQAQESTSHPADATAVTADEETAQQDAIVVTGTRSGASGFAAATPTTVISGASLERVQTTNIADTLANMPAFKASTSTGSAFGRAQTPGINQANLRSMGTQRTLVLVNGSRLVPTGASNKTQNSAAPDLNIVPEMLIDRIEVVTGGASAQWGSDAVAGVVNILLKKKYDGINIKAQAGVSTYGDGGSQRVAGLAGTSFADDRGNILLAFDYTKNDRLGDVYSRPWASLRSQIVTNSAFATNGLTALILANNVTSSSARGGLITGPANFALNGQQFVGTGQLAPYQVGTINTATTKIGGEGNSLAEGASLNAGVERFSPYLRASFDVSPGLSLYAEGSYSYVKGTLLGLVHRDAADTIRVDNAFLPANVRTAMQAQRITSFTLRRIDFDTFGNDFVTVTTKTPRGVVGLEGEFGGGWKWDAHAGYGVTNYKNVIPHNRVTQLYNFAVDSVLSGGVPVCRATLAGASFNAAAAGCVPINVIGVGNATQQAIDYSSRTSITTDVYKQTTAAFSVQGKPFSTWAGPVSVGFGAEYRKESEVVVADAFANASQYAYNNATNYSGQFDVKEAFLDVVVPLAADLPFAKSLNLNGAARIADYSTVGGQTTWKGGVSYEPFDGLRFRLTRSRDIRAPALFELYSKGSVANNTVSVRGFQVTIPANLTIGNANLKPEIANTLTIGGVLTPSWLPGFSASVDYYNIKMKRGIGTPPLSTVQNFCNAGQQAFCDFFTFNPTTGAPTALAIPTINLSSVKNAGIDFEVAYNLPLDRLSASLPGTLNFSLNGSYAIHLLVDTGVGDAIIDRAGENSSLSFPFALPRFRLNSQVTYSVGKVSLTAQVIHISKGVIDKTFNTAPSNTINNNVVPAVTYLNLFGRFNVSDKFEFFGGIKNVFSKAPPAVPNQSLNSATEGAYYDTMGRYFQMGVDFKF
jgi:iron complex outermembrane recepter protein